MKEYIKGNRRLRIVDKGDGYVRITYTVAGEEVCSAFLPKNAYKSSVRFILSTWMNIPLEGPDSLKEV